MTSLCWKGGFNNSIISIVEESDDCIKYNFDPRSFGSCDSP